MKKFSIKTILFLFALAMAGLLVFSASAKDSHAKSEENLKRLMDGNSRYAAAKLEHPRQGADRRSEIAKGQHPIAVIVSCSDSRVPPEIIFDQGLGDLFVIRVAGNVLNDINIGSIEYAAKYLKVPLVVVLGHKNCGAVAAAAKGGNAAGHIENIVEAILPAVEEAKKMKAKNIVEDAAHINVERVVKAIAGSEPILSSLVKEGKLSVIGAYYDLGTGKVDLLN